MNGKRKSRIRIMTACALVCACVMSTACTGSGDYPGNLRLSNAMPPEQPVDTARVGSFTAPLYFVSEDGRRLSEEEHSATYEGSMSRAEAAVRAMIDGPESLLLVSPFYSGIELERVELSSDVCNVYFTGERPVDEQDWLRMRAAIAATVKAVEGIDTVNVYLNGMEPGYNGRALGAMSAISEMLDVYLANMRQEYEVLPVQSETEAGTYENRTATLYFANAGGTLLIARNTTLIYDVHTSTEKIAEMLIARLLEGDAGYSSSESLEPVLPAGLTVTSIYLNYGDAPVLAEVTEDEQTTATVTDAVVRGKNDKFTIQLIIEEPAYEYDEMMMCGALTLTLTGFIPNVEGVTVTATGADGIQNMLLDGRTLTREDFREHVGSGAYVAFPDQEGYVLNRVTRAMQSADIYDPYARLAELFHGPADPGIMFPGFSENDIKNVYAVGGMAIVDWNAGFTEKLKAFIDNEDTDFPSGRREELFVYSVVNTLTEMPGITEVWMLEDGGKMGQIGNIYLGNALMRNPGIIID